MMILKNSRAGNFFFRGSTFDLSNVRFGRESGRYVNYVLFVLF